MRIRDGSSDVCSSDLGGAGRAIETGADTALDTERGVVDGDRDALQCQRAVHALDGQFKIEASAEGQRFERPGHGLVRPAAEADVDGRSGLDFIDCDGPGHDLGYRQGLRLCDAGALEDAGETVAPPEDRKSTRLNSSR